MCRVWVSKPSSSIFHNINFLPMHVCICTTGETKFPECCWLPRVPKIGHSGKRIFPECCTRGRIALGEERLSRVPQRFWHSVKSSTRHRPSSPSATLGEDRHSAKKHVTWRFTPPTPLKLKKTKILPRVPGKALGEEFLFFLFFLPHFFCEAFPHYLKLPV